MRHILLLSLLSPALLACGVSQDKLRSEVRRLENGIADLRNIQAEQTTQIETIRTDLRHMLGRVEEMDFSQRQRLGNEFESLKSDLVKLRKRVPAPAIVPSSALEADEIATERLPGDVAGLLGEALGKIRDGSFADAIPILQGILSEQPPGDTLPIVLFWSGISYEGIGEQKNALQAYHDLTTRYPKHRRAALALYRQAGIFSKLGDNATAKLTYNKLIAEFPKSEEAGLARTKVKTM